VPSGVTASFADGFFSGVVTSSTAARSPATAVVPACVADRTVKVKRDTRGRDRVVLSATTDASGHWSVAGPKRPSGRFYAQVARATRTEGGNELVCKKARSETFRP
jgi:hypothetical protein